MPQILIIKTDPNFISCIVGYCSEVVDYTLASSYLAEREFSAVIKLITKKRRKKPTDSVSETWLGNESDISIPNFNSIVKYKRPNTRAGGVAICQNSSDAVNIITPSMEYSVSQSDIYSTIQSSVGDLCLSECVIDNGQKIIIVAVFITPNKKLDDIIEFLHQSLPYTSRGSALINKNYDKIPMILSGDFNVNFALDFD
ncbi:ATP-dependent DNA helicase [Trichonephila clavipes]|nr:ATP-dependent DNA helicase [Trichonephila clavipes]